MSRRPPADAEALAVAYLGTVAAVTALTTNIGTRLPAEWARGDRAVRLTRIGGIPRHPVGHLDRARIQVDAFGVDEADAYALAATVLAAFGDLADGADANYPSAVVTDVAQDLGLAKVPDPDTGADRYLFGVVLSLHPRPS